MVDEARASDGKWALAIHGGAGDVSEARLTGAREDAILAELSAVLAEGARRLQSGGSSLDVAEDAVRRLEDSPLFNAGRGAVFNARGEHELEASIMDGRSLRAGAVAGVRGVRNPVTLARLVMERTAHVFLQGEGAMAFAREQGIELVPPEYFWSAERWEALEKARRRAAGAPPSSENGTVGAVALDRHGNLAAATSTGGMTNKLAGRVGDSPIIGAGTYASNASCAVSCTGHGEYFIRATAARDIAALVEYGGKDARAAAETVVGRVADLGGKGGVIATDRKGNVVCVFNSGLMCRGTASDSTPMHVAVRRK